MSGLIIGHDETRERLGELTAAGELPHTLLFAGRSGIGKKLAARELAKLLLCEKREEEKLGEPCGVCGACKMFSGSNHPDFFGVDFAVKEEGTADEIRELLSALSLRSFCGRGQVVIFDNLEKIRPHSANLLLKILEEPRPNVWFIMITAALSRILPTIRSRSQIVFFNALSEKELERVLSQQGILPSKKMLQLADGSAEGLADLSSKVKELEDLTSEILELSQNSDVEAALGIAAGLAADRDSLRDKISVLTKILAAELRENPSAPLAGLLGNLCYADYLIFERNLSAALVLSASFARFADTSIEPVQLKEIR